MLTCSFGVLVVTVLVDCTEVLLVVVWHCTGDVLAVSYGGVVAVYWWCTGSVLVVYWQCLMVM